MCRCWQGGILKGHGNCVSLSSIPSPMCLFYLALLGCNLCNVLVIGSEPLFSTFGTQAGGVGNHDYSWSEVWEAWDLWWQFLGLSPYPVESTPSVGS